MVRSSNKNIPVLERKRVPNCDLPSASRLFTSEKQRRHLLLLELKEIVGEYVESDGFSVMQGYVDNMKFYINILSFKFKGLNAHIKFRFDKNGCKSLSCIYLRSTRGKICIRFCSEKTCDEIISIFENDIIPNVGLYKQLIKDEVKELSVGLVRVKRA
jgi:hypothetical protein